MTDGAHMGIGAERALGTILGGEDQPEEEEQMNPVQMRAHLESVTIEDCTSYDGAARFLASKVLAYFLAHPENAQLPAEATYEWHRGERPEGDGWREVGTDYWGRTVGLDLWQDCVKPTLVGAEYEAISGFTGFMWGWAVNAARYCVELPPAPNPALMTIGIKEEESERDD